MRIKMDKFASDIKLFPTPGAFTRDTGRGEGEGGAAPGDHDQDLQDEDDQHDDDNFNTF